jgi:hypothetical protein
MFTIKINSKADVIKVQRQFEKYLSKTQILKTTARTLDITAERSQRFIKKGIRENFTISSKYLNRLSVISRHASGTEGGLYTQVSFSFRTMPLFAFKHKRIGKRGGISVEIKRGSPFELKHAFIATMRNGHKGIYQRGSYSAGRFIYENAKTASGKSRISERKSSSYSGMALNPTLQKKTIRYVQEQLPKRLTALLQQKVNKMTR